MDDVELV